MSDDTEIELLAEIDALTEAGKEETRKHIKQVRKNINDVIDELKARAKIHDQSKLEEPEASVLGKYTPELQKVEYDTDAYRALLEKVKPALEHHYAKNRHHPQHWVNGINGMTLIDLLEMFCDWAASVARVKNGNIHKSIEHNAKRFNMSDQLKEIFENTVRELLNGND